MGKEKAVYQLSDKQFAQWKDGRKVTGPIGAGGCLFAMAALPATALLAALRSGRTCYRTGRGR